MDRFQSESKTEIKSIGWFRTQKLELYQCAHQPMAEDVSTGVIKLHGGHNYEQALKGLEGFSKLWVLFLFHGAEHWKPMVQPPRGKRKMGCFATRSPHRPNNIGMSALDLLEIKGRNVWVGGHDMIDGTPVIDIKPYLSVVDAFPGEKAGWTEGVEAALPADIHVSEDCKVKLEWLKSEGLDLWSLSETTLRYYPLPQKRKRTRWLTADTCELACKTWRLHYRLDGDECRRRVELMSISTGYPEDILSGLAPSPWEDLDLHRRFLQAFPEEAPLQP